MSKALNREGLLALYLYNAYANQLVFDVVDKLTTADFTRQSSPSHDSVQQLLAHMFECEAFFLAQCRDETIAFGDTELSTSGNIRRAWERLESERRNFISTVDDAGLLRKITLEIRGQPLVFPAWQLLLQAVVHSIHHRGELSIILTELGHPLPTLDILLHFIQQSGQTWPSV